MSAAPRPPRPEPRPVVHERHGIRWEDPFAWLRDPAFPKVEDPAILAYLEAENAYFAAVTEPWRPAIEALHAEMKARLVPDDSSVPAREGAWWFHWDYAPGAQYRRWWRRRSESAEPELLLDETALAEGKRYFQLAALAVSPDSARLAYVTDEDGSERHKIHVIGLADRKETGPIVTNSSGEVVWGEDGTTICYVELNESLRPFRVRRHALGTDPADDEILYQEDDPAYFVHIRKCRSRRFIVISTGTHVTSEERLLDAADPAARPRLVSPRRKGRRYTVEDGGDGRLWIRTNDRHVNFRLVSADPRRPGVWRQELAGDDHRYLTGIAAFRDFLVILEREDGLARALIRFWDGRTEPVVLPESNPALALGENREFATDRVRLAYSSLVTPASVVEWHVKARSLEVLKVQEIPSGYAPERYVARRIEATAADGTKVPVSIVHRDDFPRDGSAPVLLYGYGAYGMGIEPAFSPHRLSLIDRGFAWAIAHVRGGDELGYRWYLDGKLEKKEHSFGDFIAAAEALIEQGYARPGGIAIRGGSAGGLLMGVVTNRRPELWRCVVADVPFVDVLNTMLDGSLPLTPIEWPEWGHPDEDPEAFRRILAYSPYDNVRAQAYPAMLVTAGLSDPRVTYWEPAKLVARLRRTKTDDRLLLLRTNMDAGHFGASGRYDSLRELAEQHAFVLAAFDRLPELAGDPATV